MEAVRDAQRIQRRFADPYFDRPGFGSSTNDSTYWWVFNWCAVQLLYGLWPFFSSTQPFISILIDSKYLVRHVLGVSGIVSYRIIPT
jgi:hypothetical protein